MAGEYNFSLGTGVSDTPDSSLITPVESIGNVNQLNSMLAFYDAQTQSLLNSGYAKGNSQQAWSLPPQDLTGNEFLQATGRINAKAKPAKPPQGLTSTGLKTGSLTSSGLTGGTSLTPDAQWNAQFEPKLASEVAPQMAARPATAVKASVNPWDSTAKNFEVFNRYSPPAPSDDFKVAGGDTSELIDKIFT